MKCPNCAWDFVKKTTTHRDPYIYGLSGLTNVGLIGINVFVCPNCGFESPIIPKIEKLHKLIAQILVRKKNQLIGSEIKFIRKNAGLPANKFAALLKIDPSHLSRAENSKIPVLSKTTDKLARVVAIMASSDNEALREVLLDCAERLEQGKPIFEIKGNNWKRTAKAA